MASMNCDPKLTKRQRRTKNLTQSYEVQVRQFVANCHQRNLTNNSIDTYERHLNKFGKYLDSVAHSAIVNDIFKETIEQYIFVLKEIEKLSPNTVNSVIRHLNAFFTYLKENEIIENSPMAKIKKLRVD